MEQLEIQINLVFNQLSLNFDIVAVGLIENFLFL